MVELQVHFRLEYDFRAGAGSAAADGLDTIHCPRDGLADSFRRRLGLAVADMGVAQCHARILVTKQAGDHRQGDMPCSTAWLANVCLRS